VEKRHIIHKYAIKILAEQWVGNLPKDTFKISMSVSLQNVKMYD